MTNFRLLSRSRQSTEYTCGPSALQAVLRYWGKDVEEEELARLAGTTSEVGTFPEDLARSARALGFKADVKHGLSLDEVQKFTAAGHPMIALAQVWLSARSNGSQSVEDLWDNGHYIVVLGVDKNYVYFQDPYVLMSKAFIPRKLFESHWHQAMGGDVINQPKLMHVGIFVRGRKPAKAPAPPVSDLAGLDFSKIGSLNLLVLQFPGILLPYDFLTELNDIWNVGQVRPNAFIIVRKDKDGAISGMEGGRVAEPGDIAAMNALLSTITGGSVARPDIAHSRVETAIQAAAKGDFGLSAAGIKRIARNLPNDHSAIIMLLENTWERRLKEVTAKHGGAILRQHLVTSEAVSAAAGKIAAAARSGRPPRTKVGARA